MLSENEEWKSMSVLGLSNYICSESGKVFNISTNKILNGSVKTNHISYNLTNNNGKSTTIGSHIIVSKLFTNLLKELKEIIDNYTWVPLMIPELMIPGLERYKICEEGKFLSTKGQIMQTHFINNAIKIGFKINNKNNNFRVCILVATMFIPNPENLKHVKFKDGDPTNINKNNLEWADNTSKIKDDPDEIWEIMIDFPKYQINPKGIRNARTHNILKPQLSSDGYPILKLCIDNNKSSSIYVHTAMATQYIPNSDPSNLIEVNHKNGVKDDFRIENLEWVTHKQNVQHAVDTGLRPKTAGNGRKIELLDEDHKVICVFNTSIEAGDHVGYSNEMVRRYMKSDKYKLDNNNNITVIDEFLLRYKVDIDLEGEIWKNVNTLYPNIDNKYKVSNYGRIKNKNKVMKANDKPDGYSQISLSDYIKGKDLNVNKNNHDKSFYIHTLVAYAFLDFEGDRKDYQVNHKDKNKRNNNIDNLEILLTRDHIIKDQGKPVLCVTQNNEYYIFPSQSKAAELLEMNIASVHYSIIHHTNHGDHDWYNYDSEEAQDIIAKFQSQGIEQSIPPPKIEIKPKRKLKLIIVL